MGPYSHTTPIRDPNSMWKAMGIEVPDHTFAWLVPDPRYLQRIWKLCGIHHVLPWRPCYGETPWWHGNWWSLHWIWKDNNSDTLYPRICHAVSAKHLWHPRAAWKSLFQWGHLHLIRAMRTFWKICFLGAIWRHSFYPNMWSILYPRSYHTGKIIRSQTYQWLHIPIIECISYLLRPSKYPQEFGSNPAVYYLKFPGTWRFIFTQIGAFWGSWRHWSGVMI